VLAVLLMLGFIRLSAGLLREKPITQITIAVIIVALLIVGFLTRLTNLILLSTLPRLYKKRNITNTKDRK
jgi:hypothetical protein